jgi:hypothetical protein
VQRSIVIGSPNFTAEINSYTGAPPVRLTVSGKIAGASAVRARGPFQQAALEIQSSVVENEVLLSYGVFAVKARFLELKVSTP